MPTTRKNSLTPLPGRGLGGDEVELGRVVGVFGVRGEVRVHLHNRESSVLLRGTHDVVLVLPDGSRARAGLQCRPGAGKRILGRLEGVGSREGAAELKNTLIVIPRDALPAVDEGEFYVADLQGLRVLVDGVDRGRVVDVHNTPGGDLLEVKVAGELHFVHFSGPHVLEVDVAGGTLSVDPVAIDDEATG